jgi:putative peptidoglycan lipid II flippase
VTSSTRSDARSDRGFLRSAGVVSTLTLASRVLGMLRDMATAFLLGGGAVNDALTYAWTIPNAFRRLFGEGALSSAFVPVFTRVLEQEGRERAAQVARSVISAVAVFLVTLVVVLVGMTYLVPDSWLQAIVGGDAAKAELTLGYTRLLLPYLAAICVIAQFMAVLNSLGEFAVPAFGPVILNAVWLCGIGVAVWWAASGRAGDGDPRPVQGTIIVGAILVAAAIQIAWHLPAMRSQGMAFSFERPQRTPELIEVGSLMGPMLLGMGCAQLNILADRTIAMAWLDDGGTTHLYYGLRLMQFPLGLVSVALVTTMFPTITRLMAAGDRAGAASTSETALRTNLLLSVPAAVGLAVLATPIVQMLFEGGEFTGRDTALTAEALTGYALGIPFAGSVMLLTRVSYAAGDVRLPVRVGLAMVVLNLGLDLALVGPFEGLGLAVATSISALITAVLLLRGVSRRLDLSAGKSLGKGALSSLALGGVLAVAVLVLDGWLVDLVAQGRLGAFVRVAAGMAAGLVAFVALGARLCPAEWQALSSLWRRRSKRTE